MYSKVINYTGLCKSCRSINNFGTVLMSEDEIVNLSRIDLLENINENKLGCPDCGRTGNMIILLFKFNNSIYDMRTKPLNGRILLQAEKVNSQLDTCQLSADNNNFSLYDYYNALKIFAT